MAVHELQIQAPAAGSDRVLVEPCVTVGHSSRRADDLSRRDIDLWSNFVIGDLDKTQIGSAFIRENLRLNSYNMINSSPHGQAWDS